MAQVIKMIRVYDLEVQYVHGNKIIVQIPRMERVPEYENYDISYDACGQKQLVRRTY